MKNYNLDEDSDYQVVDEKVLLLERRDSPSITSSKDTNLSNNEILDRYGYGRLE